MLEFLPVRIEEECVGGGGLKREGEGEKSGVAERGPSYIIKS